MEFQSWKIHFKTEVCSKTAGPHLSVHWIKEVEIAKSIDHLIKSVHSRRRVSVEEQRARKDDRFLRGRQIADMIYEYFRATGAYDAVHGPSNLFNLRLQNDDIQDFDARWDRNT